MVKEERHLLDLDRLIPETWRFTEDECHQKATGTCSLELKTKPVGDEGGRGGYEWCRGIAVFAHAWSLIQAFYGGDVPSSDRNSWITPELLAYLRKRWASPYGTPQDWNRVTLKAAQLFSGFTNPGEMPIVFGPEGGGLGLNDGRHRTCVAKRLGIVPGAITY